MANDTETLHICLDTGPREGEPSAALARLVESVLYKGYTVSILAYGDAVLLTAARLEAHVNTADVVMQLLEIGKQDSRLTWHVCGPCGAERNVPHGYHLHPAVYYHAQGLAEVIHPADKILWRASAAGPPCFSHPHI